MPPRHKPGFDFVTYLTAKSCSNRQNFPMVKPNPKPPKHRQWLKNLLYLGGGLLAIALIVLAIIYAASLKKDVAALKDINRQLLSQTNSQHEISRQQLEISRNMLALAQQQLDINKGLYSIAQQQLDVSQATLQTAQSTDNKLSSSLALQQQLLTTARLTLQQAQDINRKMPPPTPVSGLGL
jgi:urease accessory protein UreF